MSAAQLAAQTRAAAASVVHAVVAGGRLDANLHASADALGKDRALVHELSYGSLRYWWQLHAAVRACVPKPIKAADRVLESLLVVGLYQLLHTRIPDHAALDATVSACAALERPWARGLVNGVLRRVTRLSATERSALWAGDDEGEWNHPAWLLAYLRRDWPQAWRAICAANDARAPMTLRVHAGKGTRSDYLARLAAANISAAAHPACASAISLTAPVAVERLPDFAAGAVSVQDAAAQFAAPLLAPPAGARVLDACAAPGGKTAHLLEREPTLSVTAVEREPARAERLAATLARVGATADIKIADAGTPAQWWDGEPFTHILLDAPCTGTGVIRRHPDIKLHRREADVAASVAEQARLLAALWPLLARGGKLLYATCSILKAENAQQMAAFVAAHADAGALPCTLPAAEADGIGYQILPRVLPEAGGMDGFYYALLHKR